MGVIEQGLLIPAVIQNESDVMDELLGVLVIIFQVYGIDGCQQARILGPFQEAGVFLECTQYIF